MYLLQCLGFRVNQKIICIKSSSSYGMSGLYSKHSPNGVETPSIQDKKGLCGIMGVEKQVLGRALAWLVGKMNALHR